MQHMNPRNTETCRLPDRRDQDHHCHGNESRGPLGSANAELLQRHIDSPRLMLLHGNAHNLIFRSDFVPCWRILWRNNIRIYAVAPFLVRGLKTFVWRGGLQSGP